MNTDVLQLSDLTSVLRVSQDVDADLDLLEQNIKTLTGKRTDLDKSLVELDCSFSAAAVERAMGLEQFEEAAKHVHTFLNMDKSVLELASQITSDTAARDSVETLNECRGKLACITQQRFELALQKLDRPSLDRFGKLFPLIGLRDEGLRKLGVYLRSTISRQCNGFLSMADLPDAEASSATLWLNLLTQIVECIAKTLKDNQSYLVTHYGPGSLFPVVKEIQCECDTLVTQLLHRFRSRHHLTELLRAIQPSFLLSGAAGKPATLLTNTGQMTGSDGLSMEHTLAMEPIITEMVSLNTRTELYLRFMRRRVLADLQNLNLSDTEQEVKVKETTAFFANCQTVRQMQDLIGTYISLESYYLREMIIKAVGSDEFDDSTKTLRFADDLFFVLKQCLNRALSSGCVDGICAVLNHACTILLNQLITNSLNPRIRAGFPSGWMQDAYNYMQNIAPVASSSTGSGTNTSTLHGTSGGSASSVGGTAGSIGSAAASSSSSSSASANTNAASASSGLVSSGKLARQQFLVTLNTLEACLANLDTWVAHVERDLTGLFIEHDGASLRKVQACLSELKQSVTEQLLRLLDSGIEQLTSSVIRTQAKSVLQTFASTIYELTEDDLDQYATNDPWVETCVADLENFVKPFRMALSSGNNDRFVSVLTAELARRMEYLIQRKKYNRLGAIQLEKEMRCLFAYLTSITYAALRDHFTRLLQMCNLLNLDQLDEVSFYWNTSTWRLSPNEARRILAMRTEFSPEEIRRIKL